MMGLELRVVIFQDGDMFIAQALELDVAAQGRTVEQARERRRVALVSEIECAFEDRRNPMDIGPAPQKFHDMFDQKVVARGSMAA
ncbi:hypothetical protein J2X65_003990 [Ancylobacter sp. 3268]|uniref:hypothetical protein n=1 Tax=Ancylobacter sp. 3268 TaxID=2817752 RepID=UPI0028625FE3|nr:hypothetical protein [Ancylobacter sp. 3268]MDR6954616.1 hypothetical protein [Ancylobacter sp. 3268]